MTDNDDAAITALFDNNRQTLAEPGFAAEVMQKIERWERTYRLLCLMEGIAAITLLATIALVIGDSVLVWMKPLIESLVAYQWWFAAVVVVLSWLLWDPLESTCRHASLSIL